MNVEHQISSIEYRVSRAGFSLTEVLIAVGLLAMGMLFIAGAFPVSIHFTTVATERTIAPIVADEAFAKIKLYGISDINTAYNAEFAYPSTPTADPNSKQYWWAPIFQSIDINDVRVTVFVFRKVGLFSQYWIRAGSNALTTSSHPALIYVGVSASPSGRADELLINDTLVPPNFINDGYTILDDATGNIYRVLERYSASPSVIRLDKDWQGTPSRVWVASPPVNSGRYPCIGVYQKVMRF
jgi:prepilin-type N-terminal cleavage/methylation domain-containing protein